ncbi:TadE/TadG family type IV pilus assembly protein [Rugamonas apoptosis]|uniref:Pilus assembly protein n=1 Tax=Rugamonas apoptosis TaxID=2758570 RepID=A0A7W2IMH3_9BURK|nr:TadE family protein [Rugamonas apoptosis]MBA5689805.1 pilus assembly protein [Rugamonas apoptosis]
MNTRYQYQAAARQRGIAAIEFALILPYMVGLLAFLLLYGRAFFHYGAAQQAARDAARYMASVPPIALSSTPRANSEVAVAKAIAAMELADLNPGPSAPTVAIRCNNNLDCDGGGPPANVVALVHMYLFDDIFQELTLQVTGYDGLSLTAGVTMRYVGI